MKQRSIDFHDLLIPSLLSGQKTMTRRLVKPARGLQSTWLTADLINRSPSLTVCPATPWCDLGVQMEHPLGGGPLGFVTCPYGPPGTRLWVREAFAEILPQDPTYNGGRPIEYDYRATYRHGDRLGDLLGIHKKWTNAARMRREASRLEIEIESIGVERVQQISEVDAIAEGVFKKLGKHFLGDVVETVTGGELIYALPVQAREEFQNLWARTVGGMSWHANSWVWVITFKAIKL